MKKILLLLVLLGTLFITGCDDEVDEASAEVLVSKSVTIKEDYYYTSLFSTNFDAKLQVIIENVDGPAVEAYFLTHNEYNTLEAQLKGTTKEQAQYIKGLSHTSISSTFTSGWVDIPRGTYAIVVENTNFGATAPPTDMIDNEARINITIRGAK